MWEQEPHAGGCKQEEVGPGEAPKERLGGLEGEACHIQERMLLQIRLVPIVIRIKSSHSRKKFSSNIVPCRVIHSRKKFRSNIVPCSYFHLQTLWNVWYVLINFFGWGKSASVKGSITSVCILLPEEGLPGPESFPSVSVHQAPYSKSGENTQHIPSLPWIPGMYMSGLKHKSSTRDRPYILYIQFQKQKKWFLTFF